MGEFGPNVCVPQLIDPATLSLGSDLGIPTGFIPTGVDQEFALGLTHGKPTALTPLLRFHSIGSSHDSSNVGAPSTPPS